MRKSTGWIQRSQLLARLCTGVTYVQQRALAGDTVVAHETTSETQPVKQLIATVLERLPIVMPPVPAWKLEYEAWYKERAILQNHLKEYPVAEKTSKGTGKLDELGDKLQVNPVLTAAEKTADFRTLKRKLDQRLFMLVKHQNNGAGFWQFPMVELQQDETVRAAGERALTTFIGRKHPYFFIGNAPMARLRLFGQGHTYMYFMAAQVASDPWEATLKDGAPATDIAWVAKSELPQFVDNARMEELVMKML